MAILMRKSAVPSLSLQIVFPGCSYNTRMGRIVHIHTTIKDNNNCKRLMDPNQHNNF